MVVPFIDAAPSMQPRGNEAMRQRLHPYNTQHSTVQFLELSECLNEKQFLDKEHLSHLHRGYLEMFEITIMVKLLTRVARGFYTLRTVLYVYMDIIYVL